MTALGHLILSTLVAAPEGEPSGSPKTKSFSLCLSVSFMSPSYKWEKSCGLSVLSAKEVHGITRLFYNWNKNYAFSNAKPGCGCHIRKLPAINRKLLRYLGTKTCNEDILCGPKTTEIRCFSSNKDWCWYNLENLDLLVLPFRWQFTFLAQLHWFEDGRFISLIRR